MAVRWAGRETKAHALATTSTMPLERTADDGAWAWATPSSLQAATPPARSGRAFVCDTSGSGTYRVRTVVLRQVQDGTAARASLVVRRSSGRYWCPRGPVRVRAGWWPAVRCRDARICRAGAARREGLPASDAHLLAAIRIPAPAASKVRRPCGYLCTRFSRRSGYTGATARAFRSCEMHSDAAGLGPQLSKQAGERGISGVVRLDRAGELGG